jgi:hypothetical protein
MHVVGLSIEGRETVEKAAKLLGIFVRQMKRLRRKILRQGDRCGKKAWGQASLQRRERKAQEERCCCGTEAR